MKYLLLASLILSSSIALARRCVPNAQGEMAFANRCLLVVKSTWTPQCNAGSARPHLPLSWGFANFIDPYILVAAAHTATYCDVELEDCKDFALRELQKYQSTNNCGATTVGESVTFDYQLLSPTGDVTDRMWGRFQR